MPSLIKQHGHYYLQFYNSHRQPKQKRVALGTGNRRVAEQLQSRLVAAFLLGDYESAYTMCSAGRSRYC